LLGIVETLHHDNINRKVLTITVLKALYIDYKYASKLKQKDIKLVELKRLKRWSWMEEESIWRWTTLGRI